jgi:hypothetical protein
MPRCFGLPQPRAQSVALAFGELGNCREPSASCGLDELESVRGRHFPAATAFADALHFTFLLACFDVVGFRRRRFLWLQIGNEDALFADLDFAKGRAFLRGLPSLFFGWEFLLSAGCCLP